MKTSRIITVAALTWSAALLIEGMRAPSYAQGGAGDAESPVEHLFEAAGPGFHAINAIEDQGIAVQGSGPVGVVGFSPSGSGAYGVGVMGSSTADLGVGVVGFGAGTGVVGATEGLAGVAGRFRTVAEEDIGTVKKGETFTLNQGLIGTPNSGVIGIATGDGGRGVVGAFSEEINQSTTDSITAVGVNRGLLGTQQSGVQGESDTDGGFGVAGKAIGGPNAVAVYGQGSEGFAGFFRGKVTITERLLVSRIDANEVYAAKGLTGGAKLFKIDHPLDPANRFLSHGSVESTELKNMYDGIAVLDERGKVEVVLPDWFEALNRDFRYQLTPIGGYAPVYVAREISSGRFVIAGGSPGLKVSWQVTGIRHDAFARAHPVVVEQDKNSAERGRYLNPEELGFPPSSAITRPRQPVAVIEQSRRAQKRIVSAR
jgi:hypothetical protein